MGSASGRPSSSPRQEILAFSLCPISNPYHAETCHHSYRVTRNYWLKVAYPHLVSQRALHSIQHNRNRVCTRDFRLPSLLWCSTLGFFVPSFQTAEVPQRVWLCSQRLYLFTISQHNRWEHPCIALASSPKPPWPFLFLTHPCA